MNNRERKNKSNPHIGKIIGIVLALNFLPAEVIALIVFIGIVGFLFYLGFKSAKAKGNTPKRVPDNFDDCPKPICFHKDKGEHHVRKGKEIDPWDRPDIDISKYQRR